MALARRLEYLNAGDNANPKPALEVFLCSAHLSCACYGDGHDCGPRGCLKALQDQASGGRWYELNAFLDLQCTREPREGDTVFQMSLWAETGTHLYVAFRGTDGGRDVTADVKLAPIPVFGIGQVHKGFWNRASQVQLEPIVSAAYKKGKRLILCGHSLGGAVAGLVLARLLLRASELLLLERRPKDADVWIRIAEEARCVTFGQPQFVITPISNSIAGRYPWDTRLFMFARENDIVPQLSQILKSVITYACYSPVAGSYIIRSSGGAEPEVVVDDGNSHIANASWRSLFSFVRDGEGHSMTSYLQKIREIMLQEAQNLTEYDRGQYVQVAHSIARCTMGRVAPQPPSFMETSTLAQVRKTGSGGMVDFEIHGERLFMITAVEIKYDGRSEATRVLSCTGSTGSLIEEKQILRFSKDLGRIIGTDEYVTLTFHSDFYPSQEIRVPLLLNKVSVFGLNTLSCQSFMKAVSKYVHRNPAMPITTTVRTGKLQLVMELEENYDSDVAVLVVPALVPVTLKSLRAVVQRAEEHQARGVRVVVVLSWQGIHLSWSLADIKESMAESKRGIRRTDESKSFEVFLSICSSPEDQLQDRLESFGDPDEITFEFDVSTLGTARQENMLGKVVKLLEDFVAGSDPCHRDTDVTHMYMEQRGFLGVVAVGALKWAQKRQNMTSRNKAKKLVETAVKLRGKGEFQTAREKLEEARKLQETVLGHNHLEVAATKEELAILLRNQNDYTTASSLLEEVLELRKEKLGLKHRDVANTMVQLAVVRRVQNNLSDAYRLLEDALICQKTLMSPDHPHIVKTMAELAIVLREKKDYDRAKKLFEETLELQEIVLGVEHPDFARTMVELATLLRETNDHNAARRLLGEVLELQQDLQSEHSAVAKTLKALVDILQESEPMDEQPRLEKVLALQKAAFGSKHPDVAKTMVELAILLREKKEYNAAHNQLSGALVIQENSNALRADHPDVARTKAELGILLREKNDYPAARCQLTEALRIQKKALGLEHPDAMRTLEELTIVLEELVRRQEDDQCPEHPEFVKMRHELARVLYEQHKYAKAEPVLDKLKSLLEKKWGAEHPEVAKTSANLAIIMQKQMKYDKARSLLEEALRLQRQAVARNALDPKQADFAMTMVNLANLLREQNESTMAQLLMEDAAALEQRQLDYKEARKLLEEALALREAALGPDELDVIMILEQLAIIMLKQGDYPEAETKFEQVFERRTSKLKQGPEHPNVTTAMVNLAIVQRERKKYADARPRFWKALGLQKASPALGADHPNVAWTRVNLAMLLLREQHDFKAAQKQLETALKIRKKALCPEHPDVVETMRQLSSLHYEQHNYTAARPLLEELLALLKTSLGQCHPVVLKTMGKLAGVYCKQGEWTVAESLLEELLDLQTADAVLGAEHPETARTMAKLGVAMQRQSKYEEARPRLKEALRLQEQAVERNAPGAKPLDVAKTMVNLAILLHEHCKARKTGPQPEPESQDAAALEQLQRQPDLDEAHTLLTDARKLQEQELDTEHPEVATTMELLADVLCEQHELPAAQSLLEEALKLREKAQGSKPLDVARTMVKLATVLRKQDDKAARPLLQRALGIQSEALGSEHPDVVATMDLQADLLREQHDYVAAGNVLKEALKRREALGPMHPDVLRTKEQLACVLCEQSKWDDAKPLLEDLLKLRRRKLGPEPGPEHLDVARTIDLLADLLRMRGDYDSARLQLVEALELRKAALDPEHEEVTTTERKLDDLLWAQYG